MPNLFPLQFLLATFACWTNRHQTQVISYLIEEHHVLKEQLGNKRLRLTDSQRRRLAVKGHALGRRLVATFATIVTPDTILRWHHKLIAAKWTFAGKRVGRPGLMKEIRKLIVTMATDNPGWGYERIRGELKKLNHTVARTTIANTLKDKGIPPSPERTIIWKSLLKTHAEVICATDFFTTEVWTARGLVTHYVLFVIHHASRTVHIAGITTNPNAEFMAQVARNLTDCENGFLQNRRHLILDNDTLFTAQFTRILKDAGVKTVRTAYKTPNMNAFAERWVRSIKTECLRKIIPFGIASLERSVKNFVDHYNLHRPHQGIGNEPITGPVETESGEVKVHERSGGLLKHYYRSAA